MHFNHHQSQLFIVNSYYPRVIFNRTSLLSDFEFSFELRSLRLAHCPAAGRNSGTVKINNGQQQISYQTYSKGLPQNVS